MKIFKLFIILMFATFLMTGCNSLNKTNIENVSEKKIKDDIYYVIDENAKYNGEYHIETVYSDNFINGNVSDYEKENEVSPEGIVYDYYNFKEFGEIMTYDEYVNYCKSYKIEPYYSDENSNYIIISYGSGGSWTDVILANVINNDSRLDIYIWDDVYGIMGSGSAYILTIPTELSKDAKLNIISCVTKEEFSNLKKFGFMRNPDEITCDKPVIYLYPEKETKVEIKMDINGEFSCTYPLYKDSWKVTAMPNGTLYDENGLEYKYLFWEAKTDLNWNMDEGFCVKGSEMLEFFETILPQLGLNREEVNDFITYWLPQMQNNKYNIIKFQTSDYINNFKLTSNPQADTTIRVFMTWKPSDFETKIPNQKIITPERNGFTIVEWGGSKVN